MEYRWYGVYNYYVGMLAHKEFYKSYGEDPFFLQEKHELKKTIKNDTVLNLWNQYTRNIYTLIGLDEIK